jgi:hypothetical protein
MDPEHHRLPYDGQYRVKFSYLAFDDFGPDDVDYWRGMREAQLPNVGLLDEVASASNFDPLLVGRYADVLEAITRVPRLLQTMGVTHVASDRAWPSGEPAHSSGSVTFYRLPNVLDRAWIVPAGRHVRPGESLAILTAPGFDPGAEVLLEGTLTGEPGRMHKGVTSAQLALQDGPNCVTIRATVEAPGYLVLADTWYPGWQATVDGEPAELLRANHAFRALHVEAGEHQIEMHYRPRSILVGGAISLTVLILLSFGMLVVHRETVQP